MATYQSRRYCKACGAKTLHQREVFSTGLGCLLTILTAGLFFPIWFLIGICDLFNPWRCQTCGKGRIV